MRLLIVAMSESVHTARWLSQIEGLGWDVSLFPSRDLGAIHPDIRGVTVYHSFYGEEASDGSVRTRGIRLPRNGLAYAARMFNEKINPNYRAVRLMKLIRKMKPDLIHSLEIQHAGYLVLEAKKLSDFAFPPWIVTNWGSDIYLFGRLAEHIPKIRQVLATCDYYSCECLRDVALARSYGFTGKVLPVFPNTGGFDLEKVYKLRQQGLTSERRLIMLKGYQGWAYRGLVGLRALERCADLLEGYTVAVYLGFNEEMKIAAELFSHSTGVPVEMIPHSSHEDILRLHGRARISIGIAISDAISTSFLEALVMGSFPIQSWTACANEWVEDGITGLLVPPEDPDVIEKAIRRALTDVDLVNRAAELNWQTAAERLDHKKLKPKIIDFYDSVQSDRHNG